MEYVITVDADDRATGSEEKLEAHRLGLRHRAFSVFVFNDRGELLLQQRAFGKYHSGGLWTNTCCSHPAPGESTPGAAHRRLPEEMGFDCALRYWKAFSYHAVLDQGLTEHEIDHLFTGTYNDAPAPNPEEVHAWAYLPLDEVERRLAAEPAAFTVWFRLIFPELKQHRLSAG